MDFSAQFSTYSNADLLLIIDYPADYQQQAVETAKKILASRQLSEEEFEMARTALAIQLKAREQKEKNIEISMKHIGASILDIVNPIQAEGPTADKLIKIISIVFSLLFLFQLYKNEGMLRFMFTNSEAKWDFIMVLYFLPLLIIPAGTFLFFKRKKNGWALLTVILAYAVIDSIHLFILTITWKSSGISTMDILSPQISPIIPLLTFAFFGGTLWVICKENIRAVYAVDKRYMLTTLIITATLTTLILYLASL